MSSRLWFRVDDVLPLAEHAAACRTHRLTSAQTLAHASLGPALVWTGTSALDVLTSNGVPLWYGQSGTIHTATAHTWRHTTNGRRGTARTDGYDTAYLPLLTGRPTPLIKSLRDADDQGRHWVTIDIHPGDSHLIVPGRVRVVEHRDEDLPADCTWTPAVVTSSAVAGACYPALLPDGYTSTAGLELPRFERPVVDRMITALAAVHADPGRLSDPMTGGYPHLRLHDDVLLVLEEYDTGTLYREVDRIRPCLDGRYPVGAYLWDWRIADSKR